MTYEKNEDRMPNQIAAPNWRWRIQFEHHWLQSGFGFIGYSLPAPVGELNRKTWGHI
jgi:hypothetical protein